MYRSTENSPAVSKTNSQSTRFQIERGYHTAGLRLTVKVVLDVRALVLMIVDHLDNLEQIVLRQLDQTVRHLLHIKALLLLSTVDLLQFALLVRWERTGLAKKLLQSLGRVLELNCVNVLVLGSSEVEIVLNSRLSALLRREKVDRHFELAPSFVGALERWLGESYNIISRRFPQSQIIGKTYFERGCQTRDAGGTPPS